MLISLTFHRSILPPVFQSSHQIANARGLEKCVRCHGGTDLLQVKEVWPLGRVGFADYLHIFNDSSPQESEGTSTTWFPLTLSITYSHLITVALCLIPPARLQWERRPLLTSCSSVTV